MFGKDIPEYSQLTEREKNAIMDSVYERGDRIMRIFFLVHALIAIGLACFYDTWMVASVVGGAALAMFIISVELLPRHFLTRCIAGFSLQLFVALHIYQMHGLAEMHFFFFTGVTMMLVYQDWVSMWPGVVFIIVQHTVFAVYHNQGVPLYFFEDNYVGFVKLGFHFGIAIVQAAVCGYWAYLLRRNTIQNFLRNQSLEKNNTELHVLIERQNEAELRLKESYNKAEEYRLLLQSILDASPDWIFVKDREFRFTIASQGLARSLQKNIEDIQGKTDEEVGFIPEHIYGNPERGIRGFRTDDAEALSGAVVRNSYDPAMTATGEIRIFDTIKMPIRNAENEIVGALGMARDVTDLRNQEEELRRAKDEAQAADRAKSEFLANMSHEIRTPMNAILGFAEILISKLSDSPLQRYASTIYSGGRGLLTIINDILDLSKIEAGKLEFEYRPVNLYRLFGELHTFFQIKIEEKGLEFRIDIDSALPRSLLLDEVRVRQILLNIVGNAVKFTETGFIRVAVHAEESERAESDVRLVFEVEDSGIGIREDQLQKIFEAFHQQSGQSIRRHGGTGLGLNITRRLVEMMGGDISVQSEVNKGSLFKVTLPNILIGSLEPDVPRTSDMKNITLSASTVLVVDDSSANRELLKEYLSFWDLVIIEAENGLKAVELARQMQPDVIIMDMKMPEMDGYTATGILTADEATQGIPIVALTASAMTGDRERAIALGCRGFLSKPVSRTELLEELIQFLPYTLNNQSNEHDLPAKTATPEPDSVQLSPSETEGELLHQLETTYTQRWEDLSIVLIPDEVQHFAVELRQLASQYSSERLGQYANVLEQQAATMQFSLLEKTLQSYPDLLREFRILLHKS